MIKNDAQAAPLLHWRIAIQRADLPPLTKLICLNLALHMEAGHEECSPTIREQMRDTGLELSVLARHLRIAQTEGYLALDEHAGLSGAIRTSYRPTFPGSIKLPATTHSDEPPSSSPINLHVRLT